MPATALAAVLVAPGQIEVRDLTIAEVGGQGGVLRVEACGLCGTDHEQFSGALFPGWPFVPGHEVIGVIEQLAPASAQRWGVAVGDRVAVEVFQRCDDCDQCAAGTYRRCRRHGLADMIGFMALDRGSGLWGGYATHLELPADAVVIGVPAGLDPVLATVFNPLGAGLRWTNEVGGAGPGDVVAVLGPGIRGLCSVAAARHAGADFVAITGVGPGDLPRLELAKSFGADLAIDVSVDDPATALRHATGGRLADVVVDVTARAPSAFVQALELARPGGRVVVAGTRGDARIEAFSPDVIVGKELEVVGALGVDERAYRAALDLLVAGTFPFADLPRRVADLDGTAELVATMAGHDADRPVHAVVVP